MGRCGKCGASVSDSASKCPSCGATFSSGGGCLSLIFFFIPVLLAKIAGLIIGLFLKLGIVGRVVLTAMFVILAFIDLLILTEVLFMLITGSGWTGTPSNAAEWILSTVMLLGIVGLTLFLAIFWFWRKHYKVLKSMPLDDFSELFKDCFVIGIYGTMGVGVLLAIPLLMGKISNELTTYIVVLFAGTAPVIKWLLVTKEYDSEGYVSDEGDDSDGGGGDFNSLKQRAESGDANAQMAMSWEYYNGNNVEKNEKKEYEWCQRAADSGHPEAQFYIGLAYLEGRAGYPVDKGKAREWMQKAAAQGNTDAKDALKKI